jgi:hypothetical protein
MNLVDAEKIFASAVGPLTFLQPAMLRSTNNREGTEGSTAWTWKYVRAYTRVAHETEGASRAHFAGTGTSPLGTRRAAGSRSQRTR